MLGTAFLAVGIHDIFNSKRLKNQIEEKEDKISELERNLRTQKELRQLDEENSIALIHKLCERATLPAELNQLRRQSKPTQPTPMYSQRVAPVTRRSSF